MIGEVRSRKHTLRLRPQQGENENLFSIDSVSLLIGENGSGKTCFLGQIVDAFRSSPAGFAEPCEIIMASHGLPASRAERKAWGVIYYSSVPWRLRFRSNKRSRVIDASPSSGLLPDITEFQQHKDLLSNFGINYIEEVHLEADLYPVLEKALILGLSAGQNVWDGLIDADLLEKTRDFRWKTSGVTYHGKRESINSEPDETLRKLKEACVKSLHQKLVQVHGRIVVNTLLVAMFLNQRRISNTLVGTIFYDFFRIDLGRRSFPELEKKKAAVIDLFRLLLSVFENQPFSVSNKLVLTFSASPDNFPFRLASKLSANNPNLQLRIPGMSSGQAAIGGQLIWLEQAVRQLAEGSVKRVLILIDESDAFLHLDWQRKYLALLNAVLSGMKQRHQLESLQLILATHSPLLATDIPRDFICRLGRQDNDDDSDRGVSGSFAAPMQQLINQAFGSKTIGQFAAELIDDLYQRLLQGQKASAKDLYLISQIDNRVIRDELGRVLALQEAQHADFRNR